MKHNLPGRVIAATDHPANTKFSRRYLNTLVREYVGCVKLSYCRRGTGTLVGVYRSAEAGMEEDPATPWSVVCEPHGSIVSVHSRRAAFAVSADSTEFCDDCRDGKKPEPEEGGLGYMQGRGAS